MLGVAPTIGTTHPLSDVHDTVAPLLAPVSSMSGSEDPAFVAALFQLVFATTPAFSLAARLGPLPTKLMLTARGVVVDGVGTIWMPLTGARSTVFVEVVGIAWIVKPVA